MLEQTLLRLPEGHGAQHLLRLLGERDRGDDARELGNVTRLSFSNLKRGVGVDDDKFVFRVPPGVDVVEAPRDPEP